MGGMGKSVQWSTCQTQYSVQFVASFGLTVDCCEGHYADVFNLGQGTDKYMVIDFTDMGRGSDVYVFTLREAWRMKGIQ